MGRRRYPGTGAGSTTRSSARRAAATRESCGAATVRVARPSGLPSHVAISDVARAQQGGAELAPTPQEPRTLDKTRRLPMCIDLTDGGTRRIRQTAGLTVLGCVLFLASCDERPLSSPAPAGGVHAQTVIAGPFTFENFALGATPGTVCPGSSACTNGAVEPAIRADATGTFYVSSELGLSAGTLAWKSTDGGLHYTALESPNQISQACGGVGPGGGDTDLSTAPDANASRIHNVYVASLSLANVTVSTSQDGGQTWSKNVTSATIPIDDREWIAADQATKVCISYHDIVTFNIDVNCSFDAGASFTQLGSASIAEPNWVKLAPASKLQLTSMLNVTMSWYEMHTLVAWSAAIHSRSSMGIVALVTFLLQVFPPSWLVLTVTFARLRLAT